MNHDCDVNKEPSLSPVFDAVCMQSQQTRWNFEEGEMEPHISLHHIVLSIFC